MSTKPSSKPNMSKPIQGQLNTFRNYSSYQDNASFVISHPKIREPEGLGVPIQEFWINPHIDNLLEGIGGVSIFITRNTFTEFGRTARHMSSKTDSEIKITLKEVYKKSQAVEERLSTVTTDGNVLESGGMVYLNAENNRQSQLRARKPVTIQMPPRLNPLLAYMQIYQSRMSGRSVSWDLDKNTELQSDVWQNRETLSYAFQTVQLQWINCDRISAELRRAKRTQLKVLEPVSPGTTITPIVHDRFSVLLPAVPTHDAYQISKAPLGAAITVVGIKTEAGQSFLAMQACVVQENLEISLDFQPMTKDEMQEALKKLNDA